MSLRNAARDVRTMKALLTSAEQEALAAGEDIPGAEHLVLAAIELADGTARRAFERAGLDPDGYRAAIEQQHVDALRTVGIDPGDDPAPPGATTGPALKPRTRALRSTANAQRLFQAAIAEAKKDKRTPLLGAHVVLALTELERGTAARALTHMGADRSVLATAARDAIASPAAV